MKVKICTCVSNLNKYLKIKLIIIFNKCQHPLEVCNEMSCGEAIASFQIINLEDVKILVKYQLTIKTAKLPDLSV